MMFSDVLTGPDPEMDPSDSRNQQWEIPSAGGSRVLGLSDSLTWASYYGPRMKAGMLWDSNIFRKRAEIA